MNDLRYALGWLCFQAVMLLPVRIGNPAYMWLIGWAGYYAHDPRHTPGGQVGESSAEAELFLCGKYPYTLPRCNAQCSDCLEMEVAAGGVPVAPTPEPSMWERQLRAIVRHWNEFGPSHGFGEQMDCADTAIRAADGANADFKIGSTARGSSPEKSETPGKSFAPAAGNLTSGVKEGHRG